MSLSRTVAFLLGTRQLLALAVVIVGTVAAIDSALLLAAGGRGGATDGDRAADVHQAGYSCNFCRGERGDPDGVHLANGGTVASDGTSGAPGIY